MTATHDIPEAGERTAFAAEVRRALEDSGYCWLRRIDVTCESGCIVLQGCVPSYYLKQKALATALAVAGVRALRNELHVESRSP